MQEDFVERINFLIEKITILEQEISEEAELIKKQFIQISANMKENQTHFLSGIQTSSIAKSYLLTVRGVEVLGEENIPITTFIDNVLKFAHYPKKKIEVLHELAVHLENIKSAKPET